MHGPRCGIHGRAWLVHCFAIPRFTTSEPPEAAGGGFQRRTALRTRHSAAASRRTSWRQSPRCVQAAYPREPIQNVEGDVPPAAPHEMKRRSMLCHNVRRVPPPESSSSHRISRCTPAPWEPPLASLLFSKRRGRSHQVRFTVPAVPRLPSTLKGAHSCRCGRVGERLPDFFRRVAQFSDENERPLLSVLSYLRPAGRTRCVLLAIGHVLLLSVHSVPAG